MTTIFTKVSTYSRYNLSETESDIQVFVREYKERIEKQLAEDDGVAYQKFVSFAEKGVRPPEEAWISDNYERFFMNTPNDCLSSVSYLSVMGFINCVVFSPDGTHLITGHSTGLIQMRDGVTGVVLATLRNIQFPPKPVYALEYSRSEERVCYAACTDGAIYRIEVPMLDSPTTGQAACIRADPGLECLTTQYYATPGPSGYSTPFITQRSPTLALGITADQTKMVVGYGDTSVKVFDLATQEAEVTYKVHKLRLQFIPKKLQRMHFGQVCALKCHDQKPTVFATAAWDRTMRVWDLRCQIGCVMTFEGVDVVHNSIDLNRNHAISGSWQPTEALCVWDLVAHKRLNIVRVQNRRPDVDGEYIYACRYWKSSLYNRKGKYGIIGGSGTNCVEVINLHNRYITCSYPAPGTVLAIASYEERIAFGGTAPLFQIVSFYDPKHEKYEMESDSDYDYTKANVIFEGNNIEAVSSDTALPKSKPSEEGQEAKTISESSRT